MSYQNLYAVYKNCKNENVLKATYKILSSSDSDPDQVIIILKIFKENNKNTNKLISLEKLIDYYTKVIYQENEEFIIQELKERNFNIDNLIFA